MLKGFSTTTFREVHQFLDGIAPFRFQEDYDNAGLIVGDYETEVKGVLVSLDCTEAVIDEAIDRGCNLVVCHHPIVFRGMKRFNGTSYVERTVMKAIRYDIGILAIHTNLDSVYQNGVNEKIASKLGLTEGTILAPKAAEHLGFPVGAGWIGSLPNPLSPTDFFGYLKECMGLQTFKYTAICKEKISRVALCGGSGFFLTKSALAAGADVYITSDIKYHEFFDAEDRIILIDIGHFESERFTIDVLYDLISNKFTNFAVQYTQVCTNPVKYY